MGREVGCPSEASSSQSDEERARDARIALTVAALVIVGWALGTLISAYAIVTGVGVSESEP